MLVGFSMQPAGIQKGMSGKSLLYDSLKVYLNNKKRLQPIIGLNSVAECVMAGSQSLETLYLCEVCVCRLSKPDIRNHIMGSLHRYNYIKTRHPHFVAEWNESTDLSKLAWPLMEMAQLLEKREGPGDVQMLELDAAVYKELESHYETEAISLLNTIRGGWTQRVTGSQPEAISAQLDRSVVQSNRVVLSVQDEPSRSTEPRDEALKNIGQLPKAQATGCLAVSQSPAASSDGVKGRSNIVTVQPQLKTCQKSHEPSLQSDDTPSVFDYYTGSMPLIGLDCVVECRSEEGGHTYCYLCHCCQTKSTTYDVIDHLTSPSHSFSYIMMIYPDHVDALLAGIRGNGELLQSIAEKVEQQEGRGQLKVMRLPASLCNQLTGNSYHWCKKMLSDAKSNWASTNTQRRKCVAKGPSVVGTTGDGMTQNHAAELSQLVKQGHNLKKRRKLENVTDPVFKVSLPLSKGATLLKRTSFSLDKIPVSPTLSPAAVPASSPSPQHLAPELDCGDLADYEDTGPLHSTAFSGPTQRRVEVRQRGRRINVAVVQHPEGDVHVTEGRSFNWTEDPSGMNELERDQRMHEAFPRQEQSAWVSADADYENRVYGEANEEGLSNTQGSSATGRVYDESTGVMGEHLDAHQIQRWAVHDAYQRGEQRCFDVEQRAQSDFRNGGGAGAEDGSSCASSQVYYQLYVPKPCSSLQEHPSGQQGMHIATFPSQALRDFVRPPIFLAVQDGDAGPYYNGRLESRPDVGVLPPDVHASVLGPRSRMLVPSGPAQGYVSQPYLYSSIGLSSQEMPGGAEDRQSSPCMVSSTGQRFPPPHWEQMQHHANDVCLLDRFGSNHNQICHQFL